jgi:hypothetical protein
MTSLGKVECLSNSKLRHYFKEMFLRDETQFLGPFPFLVHMLYHYSTRLIGSRLPMTDCLIALSLISLLC